jgi:hypothetical protein
MPGRRREFFSTSACPFFVSAKFSYGRELFSARSNVARKTWCVGSPGSTTHTLSTVGVCPFTSPGGNRSCRILGDGDGLHPVFQFHPVSTGFFLNFQSFNRLLPHSTMIQPALPCPVTTESSRGGTTGMFTNRSAIRNIPVPKGVPFETPPAPK